MAVKARPLSHLCAVVVGQHQHAQQFCGEGDAPQPINIRARPLSHLGTVVVGQQRHAQQVCSEGDALHPISRGVSGAAARPAVGRGGVAEPLCDSSRAAAPSRTAAILNNAIHTSHSLSDSVSYGYVAELLSDGSRAAAPSRTTAILYDAIRATLKAC